MIGITKLPDRRHTAEIESAHFPRWQPNQPESALLGEQLRTGACASHDLPTLAGLKLDVVNRRSRRDFFERQGIADDYVRLRTGDDPVSHFQSQRIKYVSLLPVHVMEQ